MGRTPYGDACFRLAVLDGTTRAPSPCMSRVLKQISAARVLSPPWREEKGGLNKRARVTAGGGRGTAGDWFFGEGRLNDMLATTDR